MALRRLYLLTTLLVTFLIQSNVTRAERVLIHAGTLIDGASDSPVKNATVIVEADRIVAVESGFTEPTGDDRVIDLRDHTVMPGLMDMHVHLVSELSPTSYLEEFTRNPADYAVQSTEYARRTLMAGFTTVRDLGDGSGTVIVALRNAINRGMVVGPRIYAAGRAIATTGGHADPTSGYRQDLMGDPGPYQAVINGPDEARKAVRQRYKEGSDLIKITATGGVLSMAASGQNAQFTDEELRAVIETAKDYGFHVAAHAHGSEGMLRAVRGGVRSIEHGTYMTDEIMKEMKKRGTFYVPTISAGVFVGEKAEEGGYFPDVVRPKAAKIGPQIEETFARAVKAGVRVAFGTDSGVSPHGENAREFALMVEAGMSPMAAIKSATAVAAELLGVEDELGTITKGKIADLVAAPGDVLSDISQMSRVDFVMKSGVVYKSGD